MCPLSRPKATKRRNGALGFGPYWAQQYIYIQEQAATQGNQEMFEQLAQMFPATYVEDLSRKIKLGILECFNIL